MVLALILASFGVSLTRWVGGQGTPGGIHSPFASCGSKGFPSVAPRGQGHSGPHESSRFRGRLKTLPPPRLPSRIDSQVPSPPQAPAKLIAAIASVIRHDRDRIESLRALPCVHVTSSERTRILGT